MKIWERPVGELAYYDDIKHCLRKPGSVPVVFGLVDQLKAHFVCAVGNDYGMRLIITHNEIKARELYEDYRGVDRNVLYYPAKDFIFYSADVHGNQIVRERLSAINRIIEGGPLTVITTIDGCMDKLLPGEVFKRYTIHVSMDDEVDIEELADKLTQTGYERCAQVEAGGQFAVRGGIIDVYPLTAENPYRIELWGTQVESIRSFDAESQRSIENVDGVDIFPATELILDDNMADGIAAVESETKKHAKTLEKNGNIQEADRIRRTFEELKEKLFVLRDMSGCDSYITLFARETISFIDYFDRNDTLIVLDEPNRIEEKIRVVNKEFSESMSHRLEKGYILPSQTKVLYDGGEVYAKIGSRHAMTVSALDCKVPLLDVAGHYNINAKGIGSYNNSFETLVADINSWKKKKYRIVLVSSSGTRARRLARDLTDNGVTAIFSDDGDRELVPGEVMTTCGKLRKGYEYPDIRFVAIAEDDIFGVARKERKRRKTYEGKAISSFAELNVGDYVVHENHGLGIYRGIEKIQVNKTEKDYIKIEYADGGNLYILATQLDMIQKYAEADAKKPKLNRLGTKEWNNTKTRVRTAVKGVADELVKLYAARQQKEGFAFSPDTPWQREFEELFPYEETADQLTAISDTKKDMESRKIMDRLICGDVGYGKTEVALRAAFKAVQDGKQVAYLVPTTILAKQHFTTFDQRMKDFGVNVKMLSRFCTPKEIKETIEGLKKGLVDVVVGTHRILSKDVVFKDLGLLIIDEEQRFGVTHKEKIKQIKETVDVMTLTATPIPRTLHMSLIGIRDMSVLEEPPVDRLPIQTFVTEYDEEMVREAINRELARGGQVYYVYNKVQGIDEVAAGISRLVPDADIAFAHGQMSERELERIMVDFVNGDIDVLVSTTIIETGLDIPNVNTIIIHDSDRFGLSQLYQLRGRVGRSGRVAYAFLLYKRDKILREVAEKRLSAIREFTELGSGFKIAMKDLEIRGAGNLLGAEQHGHMEAVGYDLYCKMLNEAVEAARGVSSKTEDFETVVDVDADAFVPASYIRSEGQKLDVYKRMAAITSEDELSDMTDELIDRFGDIPRSAMNLMRIALIKTKAHNAYVLEIKGDHKSVRIKMHPKARINPAGIPPLIAGMGSRMRFTNGEIPYFTYYFDRDDIKNSDSYLSRISAVVGEIEKLREEEE
ncbi:MAG: transcription-repair coupling factor [Butyrivibrio sp.]